MPQPATADRTADPFRQIYDSEVEFVYHRLRRLGVAERDLEDKVHDVFVVVHRKLADYDPVRPVRPWIAGITVRVASDYRKSAYQRRARVDQDRAEMTLDAGPDPEQALELHRAQQLVLAALEKLDEERRAVLVLHDIEGHGMPEISELLQTSANTLYSRLRTGREQFTKAVRQLQRAGVQQ